MQRQPTLLNSCASAATAAEARFRISRRDDGIPRASRIVALDQRAAESLWRLSARHWSGAHFLAVEAVLPVDGSGREPDMTLRTPGGSVVLLSDELAGADVVVMLATALASAEAAAVIGDACAERGIMSAGLVIQGHGRADGVVSALRPNAMVLVVLDDDESDVQEILMALRV